MDLVHKFTRSAVKNQLELFVKLLFFDLVDCLFPWCYLLHWKFGQLTAESWPILVLSCSLAGFKLGTRFQLDNMKHTVFLSEIFIEILSCLKIPYIKVKIYKNLDNYTGKIKLLPVSLHRIPNILPFPSLSYVRIICFLCWGL